MKKRLAAFLLSFALVIAFFPGNVYATEPDTSVSDMFIAQCDNFFSNSGYMALDKNNNDVTESFYEDNISYYRSGNYSAIREAFITDLSAFSWTSDEDFVPNPNSRAILTATAAENFYVIGYMDGFGNKSYEMSFTLKGTYRCHEGQNYIIDCTTPYITNIWFSAGHAFSYTRLNEHRNGQVLNNNTLVKFSASFDIQLTYTDEEYGVVYSDICTPTQSVSFTRTPI